MKDEGKCEGCGKPLLPGEWVSLGSIEEGHRNLCMACYNATVAEFSGVAFEHADFEPMRLTDADGVEHEFHFGIRLLGDIVALDAFEMKEGERTGYDFQVIGDDPEGEALELFGKLLEKMRRSLARRHLEKDEDGVLGISKQDTVRAIIEEEPDNMDYKRTPLLIIDGKEIPWDDFGRMLMTYVGFSFKMEIYDKSEER